MYLPELKRSLLHCWSPPQGGGESGTVSAVLLCLFYGVAPGLTFLRECGNQHSERFAPLGGEADDFRRSFIEGQRGWLLLETMKSG